MYRKQDEGSYLYGQRIGHYRWITGFWSIWIVLREGLREGKKTHISSDLKKENVFGVRSHTNDMTSAVV